MQVGGIDPPLLAAAEGWEVGAFLGVVVGGIAVKPPLRVCSDGARVRRLLDVVEAKPPAVLWRALAAAERRAQPPPHPQPEAPRAEPTVPPEVVDLPAPPVEKPPSPPSAGTPVARSAAPSAWFSGGKFVGKAPKRRPTSPDLSLMHEGVKPFTPDPELLAAKRRRLEAKARQEKEAIAAAEEAAAAARAELYKAPPLSAPPLSAPPVAAPALPSPVLPAPPPPRPTFGPVSRYPPPDLHPGTNIPVRDPYLQREWPKFIKGRAYAHRMPPPAERRVGRVVVYWVSSCPRLRDNFALRMALWTCQQLQLPLALLTTVSPDLASQATKAATETPPVGWVPTPSARFTASAWSWFVNTLTSKQVPVFGLVGDGDDIVPPLQQFLQDGAAHVVFTDESYDPADLTLKEAVSAGCACPVYAIDSISVCPPRYLALPAQSAGAAKPPSVADAAATALSTPDAPSNAMDLADILQPELGHCGAYQSLCSQAEPAFKQLCNINDVWGPPPSAMWPPPALQAKVRALRPPLEVPALDWASLGALAKWTVDPPAESLLPVTVAGRPDVSDDCGPLCEFSVSSRTRVAGNPSELGALSVLQAVLRFFGAHALPHLHLLMLEAEGSGLALLWPFIRVGCLSPLHALKSMSALPVVAARFKHLYVLQADFYNHTALTFFKRERAAALADTGGGVLSADCGSWFNWQNLLPDGVKEAMAALAAKGSSRTVYYPRDMTMSSTKDNAWNCIQTLLLSHGVLHPALVSYYGQCVLQWCMEPNDALGTLVAMLRLHALAPTGAQEIVSFLVQVYGVLGDERQGLTVLDSGVAAAVLIGESYT